MKYRFYIALAVFIITSGLAAQSSFAQTSSGTEGTGGSTAGTATGGASGTGSGHHGNGQGHHNAACEKILDECKKLGFIKGQWKKDNGLYKDCFEPVLNGTNTTRDGKPISVPVSPEEIEACRAAKAKHEHGSGTHKNEGKTTPETTPSDSAPASE